MTLQIFALAGIGEIRPGDDLAAIIIDAADGALRDGDIVSVTSKIVSKAEDRFVQAADREQAITDETVRVVASRDVPGGTVRIVENRLGIVAAAAGVDSSSVPVGTVLLLPLDPDASAQRIVERIRERLGIAVGVVVTDTLGRAWRVGQTDAAIGIAGMDPVLDLRGRSDEYGQEMNVTVTAVADEIASATDLVKGKAAGRPVAVVRGLGDLVDREGPGEGDDSVDRDGSVDRPEPTAGAESTVRAEPHVPRSAKSLLRPRDEDMFHTGSAESWSAGYAAALREHGIAP